MNHLPIELLSPILQHIDSISHLIQCALVNRSFYKATLPILWRSYVVRRTYSFKKQKISAAQFIECLQHNHPLGTHVRQLELRIEFTDTQLVQLMTLTTPHLDSLLTTYAMNNTDLSFQYVPHYWPHLTKLEAWNSMVTQVSMDAIGLQCHDLRALDFPRAPNLGPRRYQVLADAGRRLDAITLSDGIPYKPWTLDTIMDVARFPLTHLKFSGKGKIIRDMLSLTHLWPHLTSLLLKNLDFADWPLNADDDEMVDERLLIGFLQSHPQLVSADLINMPGMTHATLGVMARCLPLLRKVSLGNNNALKPHSIKRFVRDCFQLEYVCLGFEHYRYSDFFEVPLVSNSIDNNDDDSGGEYQYLSGLYQKDMEIIRQIGPQGVDIDLENGNELAQVDHIDDDDDKAWLRTWKRSYVNLRLYGSGVA